MKQMTLATGTGFELYAQPTRKAEFLAKMETLNSERGLTLDLAAVLCEIVRVHK